MISIPQQLPGLFQHNSTLIPKVLAYVFVVLIAMSSAKLVWSMFTSNDTLEIAPNNVTTAPKLVSPPPPKPDFGSQIARLHIMGKASIADSTVVVDKNAPDTSLNLTLSGVLALGAGEGFAIIQNERKKHKFYQLDEEVTSGVTLHSVYSDYVLLSRSGRTEKLSLPKASKLTGTNQLRPTERVPQSNTRRPGRVDNNETPSAANQPNLSSLKNQLTKNPSSLGKYINISTANDEETGKFMGYKIKPNGSSSALFDQLGFMENDVITKINDIQLDSPNKASQVLKELVSTSELNMTVLRAGTEISLIHYLE